MAELVPDGTKIILDLGCGTGLELDRIFKRLPNVSVVGIDLTRAMLDRLKQKYPGKNIKSICGNYFNIEFGESSFDTAVSFQTMHHYTHDEKVNIYRLITRLNYLRKRGFYLPNWYTERETRR